jgi:hypothetical protein
MTPCISRCLITTTSTPDQKRSTSLAMRLTTVDPSRGLGPYGANLSSGIEFRRPCDSSYSTAATAPNPGHPAWCMVHGVVRLFTTHLKRSVQSRQPWSRAGAFGLILRDTFVHPSGLGTQPSLSARGEGRRRTSVWLSEWSVKAHLRNRPSDQG